jgi:lysophospholipase L1-like esterase
MNVLLFGSSIIRNWNNFTLKQVNENIVNKGISGLHTKELLSDKVMRILELNPQPKYLFFYCGTNDIVSNVTSLEIAYNLQKFLQKISRLYPNTTIIVLSLIKSPKLVEFGKTNQIDFVNTALRKFCKKNDNMVFINVNLLLDDNNTNNNKYFLKDGVHLSSLGYKKINSKLIDLI